MGNRAVQAIYSGATGFDPSSGSTTLTVARAKTTTAVTITPSTGAVAGQDLGFQVGVTPTTPALGVPTGTITATVGGMPFIQEPLPPTASFAAASGFPRSR